jgi:Sap, sulfolipid-1-addressing protein
MLAAIGQSLPIAVGLLLAALPMVLITLVLATKRPASVSWAFLGGWMLGLGVVGSIVIAAADVVELNGAPPRWAGYVKIVLGALLLFLALRKGLAGVRSRDAPEMPKWMAAIGSVNAGKAFGLAFLLAAANPKNLVLVVSGGMVIADATSVPREQFVALAVFVVVASFGVGAPAVVRGVLGDQSGPALDAVDTWMTRNSAVIMSAVLLVLGVVLIVNGVGGL